MALKRYGSPNDIVYVEMDDFVMKAAELVTKLSTKTAAGKAARRALQLFFSDFIETKWGLGPEAKKALGSAAPDIITTEGEIRKVLGVTASQVEDLKAERTIELKSKVGSSSTTLTQYTVSEADVSEFSSFFGGNRAPVAKEAREKYTVAAGRDKGTERTRTVRDAQGKAVGRDLYDQDGNLIIGNLSSQSVKDWVLNGQGKAAKTLRAQVTMKAKESLEINLKYDELKKGSAKKYTLYPALDPKKHFNYNISSSGVVQVEYSSEATKLAEQTFFKLANTTGKPILKEFLAYLNVRLAKATQTDSIVTLINVVKEFQPGLTPFVIQASLRTVQPFYKGRVTASSKRGKGKKQPSRGKFLSSVQLTAIMQKRLEELMPRGGPPQRPIPKWRTGELVRSFRFIANYRQNLITYYSTPPGSAYAGKLNRDGWELDTQLVRPTIRQVTQALFGREFRVLRR